MDRIIKTDKAIVVSQDKTRYKNYDASILHNWYPSAYKTMKLLSVMDKDGYINYEFDMAHCKLYDVKSFTTLEKLYCAYSFFSYEKLFEDGYYASFEDDNIYLDASNSIELIFVEDKNLYIENLDVNDYFTQVKARVLSMFSKYSYNEILKSNFTLNFSTEFEKKVLNSESVESLKQIIVSYIDEQEVNQSSNFSFVKKKSFMLYRAFTFILLILFLGMTAFSVFSQLYTVNNLEFESNLYQQFVDKNYSEVLKISVGEDLTLEQKYIVGYAGIMMSALDNEKKEVILSTYSKNVSESIMDYWIYIGYGDYVNAIDKGKAVNNDEYVLYALRLEENRLLKDEKMDGAKKEAQIKAVQSEIDAYEKELDLAEEVESDE